MTFDIYETNNYIDDVAALGDSFEAGWKADVTPLVEWLRSARDRSMLGIGAGGSLAVAQIAATFHEHVTGKVSRAATPLGYFDRRDGADTVGLVFSASGRHRDVRTIASELGSAADAADWCVFLGTPESAAETIMQGSAALPFVTDILPANYGWLSVGALVGQSVVIARAYSEAFPELGALRRDLSAYLPDGAADPRAAIASLAARGAEALSRPRLSVIHGNDGLPTALDIDSKFAESGLGALSMSEYRNFAHGRYQMLLPEPETHGLLVIDSARETRLADTTLEVLPESIPALRLTLPGENAAERSISSIIAAVVVIGSLGEARGIRPGWGSRDTFGDVLYEMPLEPVFPSPLLGA